MQLCRRALVGSCERSGGSSMHACERSGGGTGLSLVPVCVPLWQARLSKPLGKKAIIAA